MNYGSIILNYARQLYEDSERERENMQIIDFFITRNFSSFDCQKKENSTKTEKKSVKKRLREEIYEDENLIQFIKTSAEGESESSHSVPFPSCIIL